VSRGEGGRLAEVHFLRDLLQLRYGRGAPAGDLYGHQPCNSLRIYEVKRGKLVPTTDYISLSR
jgi:hypothetical protein